MTRFQTLPPSACWRHGDVQVGFEASFFRELAGGWHLSGSTSGIEHGVAWTVDYEISVDSRWRSTAAVVRNRSADGPRTLRLESAGEGTWLVDGAPAPQLDGCLDIDLESSATTNTLPVHRLALEVGDEASAPAVYVRAADLSVERLDQRGRHRFDYLSVEADFRCVLQYDAAGLVIDYPDIATRVA